MSIGVNISPITAASPICLITPLINKKPIVATNGVAILLTPSSILCSPSCKLKADSSIVKIALAIPTINTG